MVAVAIGGAALLGGVTSLISSNNAADAATQGAQLQADSANKGAQLQADAANHAVDIQDQQFQQTRNDFAPWRTAGASALGQQTNLLGLNGADPQANAFSQFRADPGYQYTVDQSNNAVQRSAAARGLLTSGATIKAIQDRASNLADQGYGNYYNRLAGVAGTGQTATGSTATAGAQAATNEGAALIGGANARASGYNLAGAAQAQGYNTAANAFTGGASGFTGSINSGLNNYFALKGYGGGGGSSSYTGDGNGEFYGLGGA